MWWPERQVLLYVDIMRGRLNLFDPDTLHHEVHEIGKPVGTVVIRGRSSEAGEEEVDESHSPLLLGTKDGFEE